MGGTSIIDRILNAIDKAAEDYGEWSAWGSSMDGHKTLSGEPHHEWNCESEAIARIILQYLATRGMAVKPVPDASPDLLWIHIEKRKGGRRDGG